MERVPLEGPVLFVANHINSLVDPVLLIGCLPRVPRFLAKSTLWQNRLITPFLTAAGAIPVYRRQDEGADPTRNVETFAQCHEKLARGHTVALFPEGASHDEPHLLPLRTGVARIALEAERRLGPLGLRIVPVGLVFDEKETFRSRALVLVGEPLDPIVHSEQGRGADPDAVHELTERVSAALAEVTPNYDSWQQAALVERAAGLFARPESDDTRRSELSEAFALRKAFREGFEWMTAHEPQRLGDVATAIERYQRLLDVARLRDEQVAATYPKRVVARYLARTLVRLLLWLPPAMIGMILNWIPYRLVGRVAARTAPTPDTRATYKLFAAVFLFPIFWILETALALWLWGGWVALAMAVGAPLAGYAALTFDERRRGLFAEARAFLMLHSRRRGMNEVVARRRALVVQIRDLAERYVASQRVETERRQ